MDDQQQYITLNELSEDLGLDKSNARKWIRKQGFEFIKVRDQISRQMILALTVEDAEAVREIRQRQGFTGDRQIVVDNGWGYFYIVQVMPDVIPNRVKLGYAGDCQTRLRAYTTVSPTAQMVKCWPCSLSWEAAAIASLTRVGCIFVGGEVFDCDDLEALARRGEEFFLLMPQSKR